jgi:hypothetical protein
MPVLESVRIYTKKDDKRHIGLFADYQSVYVLSISFHKNPAISLPAFI